MIMIVLSYIGIRNEILLVNNFLRSSDFISFKVVFHSKFPIFAYFLNIHKASPNTNQNIICMFLKRKTISKPENSSLRYTNQGKTTILPRAIMVFSWFTLLFEISMALFYLIPLIYALTS